MSSNLEQIKSDLENLINFGGELYYSIQYECYPEKFIKEVKKNVKDNHNSFIDGLPDFRLEYQTWYTEAISIIKILIPDRLADFIALYKKPHGRKTIDYSSYVIEDCLQNLSLITRFEEKILGPEAAIPKFLQQLNILKSSRRRLESSLFEIKQILQADLFDTELDSANELNNKGFVRGAGAIAGVVLEKHLSQVCESHRLTTRKKKPTISDFNDMLKNNDVLDIPDWRFIQRLVDLRNLCDHDKKREPTKEEVGELIEGVDIIIKRIF